MNLLAKMMGGEDQAKNLQGSLGQISPMLLAMSKSLGQGQGAFTEAPNGMAAMMARDNAKRDALFRQSQAALAQQNANRSFELQKMNADRSFGLSRSADTRAQQGFDMQVEDRKRALNARDAFNHALGLSESGNRYDIRNKEGFAGRYQVGQQRLTDYNNATGQSLTLDEFQASPEAQEKVQEWHINDIDSFINDRGLDKYIGQTVGGVKITREGLYAGAHIGGKGGMARFLASDGKYNPKDSNETSISDYIGKFGNVSGGQAQAAPDKAALQAAMYNPDLSDLQRKQAADLLKQMEPAQPNFANESALRKEFNGLQQVKAFTEQSTAFGRIVASASDPSPAGDLALIFNYMKVLDPGSVVRESEFATAAQAAAWLERSEEAGISVPRPVMAAIRKAQTGQRLSEEQRSDFVGTAERLYGDAERQYMGIYNQFSDTASEYGLDVERVLTDYRYKPAPARKVSPQALQAITGAAHADLLNMDITKMSNEEMDAWEARLMELTQ